MPPLIVTLAQTGEAAAEFGVVLSGTH